MSSHSPLRRTSVRVAVEHLEGLLLVGLGVARRSRSASSCGRVVERPLRVADARGVVADDQHDRVAEVLELAQLAQHDGVAEVDVRRGRVDAELDPQRPAPRAELALERARRQRVDGVAGEEAGVPRPAESVMAPMLDCTPFG